MNYGVIDLGSNTVRLSVYGYDHDHHQIKKIFTKKEVVGLATYVTSGELSPEGIEQAIVVLKDFQELSHLVNVSHLYVFATASLRNIHNGRAVAKLIEEKTGVFIDILSGDDEATLGFKGISQIMKLDQALMIDIGGASTELVWVKDGKPVHFTSVPVGCLNLYLKHVSNLMPTGDEIRDMKSVIKKHIEKLDWAVPPDIQMIGVGGTCRASVKLSNRLFELAKDREFIEYKHLREIGMRLKGCDSEKTGVYHTIYKIVPERIFTISSGMTILRCVMKKFDCNRVTISQYGVREGYFIDRVIAK